MKRLIGLLLILCMGVLLFPMVGSAAASYSYSIAGNTTVRVGNTLTYTVRVTPSGGKVAGFQGTFKYDTNLFELKSVKSQMGGSWSFQSTNGTGSVSFVAYDSTAGDKAISARTNAFTVTLKVKNVAVGTKGTLTATPTGAGAGNSGTLTATVAAPLSANANLSALSLNYDGMTPAFQANTTSYNITVPYDVSSVKVTAKTADAGASVSISGNQSLVPEKTTPVTVTVTAPNGTKKVYTIYVKRDRDPNREPYTDNTLKSLTVDSGVLSPAFSAEQQLYLVHVPYEVETLTVTPEVNDEYATVQVTGGEELKAGQYNRIEVLVTAENGDERIYEVMAYRGLNVAGGIDLANANLASLSVTGAELTFDPQVQHYEVTLPHGEHAVEILAKAENEAAQVEILGEPKMQPGEKRVFTVTVTAPNTDKKIYTVGVTVEDDASNNLLGSLQVTGGTVAPALSDDVFTYNITAEDVKLLEVAAAPAVSGAKVEYYGLETVQSGRSKVFAVAVTSQSGAQRVYSFLVNQGEEAAAGGLFDEMNLPTVLILGVALLVVGILMGVLITVIGRRIREKHAEEDEYEDDSEE